MAQTRTLDFGDRGFFISTAAEEDLVEFLALLVDAENADVADMMMAAGIDAAGNLDRQRADFLLPLGRAEALGDALGDVDRAGVGQRAIVETRAGDDVGDEAGIGGGQPGGLCPGPGAVQTPVPQRPDVCHPGFDGNTTYALRRNMVATWGIARDTDTDCTTHSS